MSKVKQKYLKDENGEIFSPSVILWLWAELEPLLPVFIEVVLILWLCPLLPPTFDKSDSTTENHILTTSEIPSHSHTYDKVNSTTENQSRWKSEYTTNAFPPLL